LVDIGTGNGPAAGASPRPTGVFCLLRQGVGALRENKTPSPETNMSGDGEAVQIKLVERVRSGKLSLLAWVEGAKPIPQPRKVIVWVWVLVSPAKRCTMPVLVISS